MKTRVFGLFGALAFALTLASGSARACPVGIGGDDGVQGRPRPVVNDVSVQANELIQRASRMESMAMARDESARRSEMQANVLMNRARMLRNQASLVAFSEDGQDLIAAADELSIRAAEMRSRAADERAQASALRMQARTLRERALVMVRGGGGGWHRRGPVRDSVRDFAAPPPSTRSETTVL